MNESNSSRRDFIKKSAFSTVGITVGAMGFSASSYGRILGAIDRVNIGIVGFQTGAGVL